MAAPIIFGLGIIGRYLLRHGIKKAIKKYGKTAVNKVVKVKEPKLTKEYLLRLKTKLIDKYAPIKKLTKKVTKTKPSKKMVKVKKAALKGRKVSTDFGKALDYSYKTALRGRKISTKGIKKVSTSKGIKKALEYSPPFMLRNLIRDSLSATAKRPPSKKILKKVITGGGIFASGALTGTASEKGKQSKKDIAMMKKLFKKANKKSKKKEEN